MISVVIPVYNEEATVETIIERVRKSLVNLETEIIVVDDGSRDRTGLILDTLSFRKVIRLVRHPFNLGKGEAVRSALNEVKGSITVIQDADLEYDPNDLPMLIKVFDDPQASVVYGSRNLKNGSQSGYRPFLLGGKLLSLLASLLYGQRLTDINTGYKLFRTDFIRSLNLESKGFEFCEEVTAKIRKRGINIEELPISYHPRKFSEGKKIGAVDGLVALLTLLRYRF